MPGLRIGTGSSTESTWTRRHRNRVMSEGNYVSVIHKRWKEIIVSMKRRHAFDFNVRFLNAARWTREYTTSAPRNSCLQEADAYRAIRSRLNVQYIRV